MIYYLPNTQSSLGGEVDALLVGYDIFSKKRVSVKENLTYHITKWTGYTLNICHVFHNQGQLMSLKPVKQYPLTSSELRNQDMHINPIFC